MVCPFGSRGGLKLAVMVPAGLLGGCAAGPRDPAHEAEYPPPYYGHPFTVIGDETRRDGWSGGVWPGADWRSPVRAHHHGH
jgi:hypothetical protein